MTTIRRPDSPSFRAATGVVRRLRSAGRRAYLVGGCVRDLLLGLDPKDYDVATDATPDEAARIFEKTIEVGRAFGVTIVPTETGPVEVATFRADGVYLDGRRPSEVRYAGPEEDVRRRDFTINALMLDPETLEVIDLVGGVADLEARRLRAIGDAEARFREDRLRPLRAVRFAARLRLAMDPATEAAVRASAPLVADVAAERTRDELTRILTAPRAGRALLELHRLGLLPVVLPEVEAMVGVPQPPEFHPEGDVFTHTAILLDLVGLEESPSAVLGWGALLHDVGKPPTFGRAPADEGGRIRFHEHCEVGARMAVAIGRRLRLSNDVIDGVVVLVRDHLKFKDVEKMRPGRLRRWVAEPHFEDLLALHRLDCLASHGDLSAWRHAMAALDEHRRLAALPPRILTGHLLIEWGAAPGPAFKETLTAAYEAQLEGVFHDIGGARRFVEERFPGLLPRGDASIVTAFFVLLIAAGVAATVWAFLTAGYGALYAEARAALERGETAEAIQRLERLIRRYPQHAEGRHLLAVARRRRGENDAALRHLEAALRAPTPGLRIAEVHALRADILRDLGRPKEALEALGRAAEAAPTDAALQVRLCEAAAALGENPLALAAIDRALALPGADRRLQKIRGKILLVLGRTEEAIAALREAAEAAPEDGEAALLLAEALEKRGDPAAAEAAYRRALEALGPRDEAHAARAHLGLGRILEARDDIDGALEHHRKALAGAEPDTAAEKEALYRLGVVHARRGEEIDAVSFWERLYRIDPAYADVVERLRIAPGVLSDADVLGTVRALAATEFRDLVDRILQKEGHRVERIEIRDNAAVDAVAARVEEDVERRRVVHVRRWPNDVGELPLKELHLAVLEAEADGGIFATTSGFSATATKFIQTVKVIEAIAGDRFARMVREAGFGP